VSVDPVVLLTIIGMGLVTYATRAGGLLLIGKVRMSPFVERWLGYIPGCVLLSIVAPSVFTGGAPGVLASLATLLVALRTRNLLLSMVVGVVCVVLLRKL
jgi:uncharacterized membrane protein